MKTVAFHNLGCKVNSYEMEVMQQKFIQKGYVIVPFDDMADIYVVNTCSVTNIADRKSRQMLHRARKLNPDAVVIAAGCYAQTDTEGASADAAVDIVIGNNRKSEIVEITESYLADGSRRVEVDDLSRPVDIADWGIDYSDERTRVDIKIQDGCDQFCTYCIIPYARGRTRSRDAESVREEVRRLADRGFKEIVLTGIHLSSYGMDISRSEDGTCKAYNTLTRSGEYTNEELIRVIEEVSSIDGIERVRLGSLEPRIITERFLDALSRNPKVCPHFHLSLQSGCDEVLIRMNRHYTTQEYYDKVCMLRKYYVNPAITTDIITGFPGETKEEFSKTVEFVEKVRFYETHIFKYSMREGTAAARMDGQLPDSVKSVRSDVLDELNRQAKRAFMEAHIGRICTILAEEEYERNGHLYMKGYTEDYVASCIPVTGRADKGMLLKGRASGISGDYLMLEY